MTQELSKDEVLARVNGNILGLMQPLLIGNARTTFDRVQKHLHDGPGWEEARVLHHEIEGLRERWMAREDRTPKDMETLDQLINLRMVRFAEKYCSGDFILAEQCIQIAGLKAFATTLADKRARSYFERTSPAMMANRTVETSLIGSLHVLAQSEDFHPGLHEVGRAVKSFMDGVDGYILQQMSGVSRH